jgi:hypothetical protein
MSRVERKKNGGGMTVPRTWLTGIFLIALSLLLIEVTFTRVFSLIMWYHFAVLSISLALFGTATAGLGIYLYPQYFPRERLGAFLQWTSFAYSISVVASFIALIGLPVNPHPSVAGLSNLSLVYLILVIPFFFGGLCLSLAITHLSVDVSTVYFADLLGASIGCILVIPALNFFGGPGTILLAAVTAAFASLIFSERLATVSRWVWAGTVTVIGLLVFNHWFDVLKIQYVKGGIEGTKLYEGWNSFSRIAVFPPVTWGRPFGWGLSGRYDGGNPGWMRLSIDGMAETPITRFNGDWESVNFLAYDVSNIVHSLKRDAKMFIIGPGGGRDVLSALFFKQRHVDGVELNPLVVHAVRDRFGDFAGNIYKDPRVTIWSDDGRNFLARSRERYSIIQASAVDTWAATAAGAFALSENNLYTREAFRMYFEHLEPDGILTVSRYVYPHDRYGEALRLTGLALSSWKDSGAQNPRDHLMMVGTLNDQEDTGYVSLLMKQSPFTQSEVDKVQTVIKEKGFVLLYAPFGKGHGVIRDFVMSDDYPAFWQNYPINVAPPTDDQPFFFQMLRFSDVFRLGLRDIMHSEPLRIVPVATFGGLMIIVTTLSLCFIIGPLWLLKRHEMSINSMNIGFIVYFSALGVGFMMIEVGLMQKFILLLGHPVYSLAVILFTILLSSSLGSLLTIRTEASRASVVGSVIGLILIVLLPLYIMFLPLLQYRFMGSPAATKIAVSCVALFPLGLMMGTFFPLGMKRLSLSSASLIPWCWAVNGATSVFASVFALAVGIQAGIQAELIVGWVCYVAAFGILMILAATDRSKIEQAAIKLPHS